MTPGHEKRRTPRVPIHFKVRVETIRGTFHGMGRDISEGGIGVYLKKLPPIGSHVEIEFSLSEEKDGISLTGEVMYHRRGGAGVHDDWMGVKFVRMDAESLAQIQEIVKADFDRVRQDGDKPPPLT